ncbi:type II toxin-antitoxin system VapC family toxin [Arthrobacter tecti]
MIIYVDTSAALKLLVDEPESEHVGKYLTTAVSSGARPVASMLLHTELHCAAARRARLPAASINTVLNRITLVDVTRADLMYAAALPGSLRSADAIHLATAIRLECDQLIAYDLELNEAATRAGITVVAPTDQRGEEPKR